MDFFAITPMIPSVSCDLCSVNVNTFQKKKAVLTNTLRITTMVDCNPRGVAQVLIHSTNHIAHQRHQKLQQADMQPQTF